MPVAHRSAGVAFVALAAFLGGPACQDLPPAALVVDGVSPNVIDPNAATTLTIRGEFYLVPHVSFASGTSTSLPTQFHVQLADLPLNTVTYESPTTLLATVPAGLPAGAYGLTVINPQGGSATLTAAVTVRAAEPASDGNSAARTIRASLAVTPRAGDTNTIFNGSAAGSTAPAADANQLTYGWDWESDGTIDSVGITARHRYTAMGAYKVTLTVSDPNGVRDQASEVVLVINLGKFVVLQTPASDTSGATLRAALAQAQNSVTPTTLVSLQPHTVYLDEPLVIPAHSTSVNLIANQLVLDANQLGSASLLLGTAVDAGAGCLQMLSSNSALMGVQVRHCAGVGLAVSGGNNIVAQCTVQEGGVGIQLAGSNNYLGPQNQINAMQDTGVEVLQPSQVTRNFVRNAGVGIHLVAPAAGSTVSQNQLVGGQTAVLIDNHTANVGLWSNTLVGAQSGVNLAGATQVDMRNNLVVRMSAQPVLGGDGLSVCDYNDFFANGAMPTACSGSHNLTVDPQFVSGACGDYSIRGTSPVAHAGMAVSGASSSARSTPPIGACSAP